MSAPGQLVEYLQARRLTLGFCLRKDKAGSLLVRNEDNREEKVPLSRVLLTCDSGLPPEAPADAVVGRLREAARQRESIAASIPLNELWELLKDEEAPGGYSLTGLARIYFGDRPSPEEISGLYRALEADRVYFQRKGDSYLPRPARQVEESLTRLRVEAEREEERRAVAEWLARLWQHAGPGPAPAPPAGMEDAARRYLTWLRETALFGAEAGRFQEISALLRAAGISRKDAAFRLLVKAGVWSEHENLALHRNRVQAEFPPDLVEEARRLAADPSPLQDPTRLDLRHLFCFSVDDPATTEIDDALSFERRETGWRVGVHIADAAAYVPPGSPLDKEARQRATAIYLPDLKVLMLPSPLSEDACSLVAGSDRPAFSFLVDFDEHFHLQGYLATPSLIRVGQRHSYDTADEWLARDEQAAVFLALARALRSERRKAGAVTIPLPRVQVRLDASGHPIVEKEATSAPSQVLAVEHLVLLQELEDPAGKILHFSPPVTTFPES
ncbi:MAG TPA: RNB domain-containing ribonuclease [Candidatus Nitrosotenuis sp.]|nr:RNB domain-containing ribonuclease [Candidatus Nitrosotenuis sp.]